MGEEHPLKEIVRMQKQGIPKGIYSACTANDYVIEACMERALMDNEYVLIEATANQVNQFGGYTGMSPSDFKEFVNAIAKKTGFPENKIILGGDHLGPLTWKDEKAIEAMEKAEELISQFVLSGFTKIHIDTSMHLADDDLSKPLNTEIIAQRGARLAKVAEDTFKKLVEKVPNAIPPVYVVGSEVPVPGGSQHEEEGISVTKAEDFEETVEAFKRHFGIWGLKKHGIML